MRFFLIESYLMFCSYLRYLQKYYSLVLCFGFFLSYWICQKYFIESQNQCSWKRPPRLCSQTIKTSPPCSVNHVLPCHIYMLCDPSLGVQGMVVPHSPWAVPVLFLRINFFHISNLNSPMVQLEAITSCPAIKPTYCSICKSFPGILIHLKMKELELLVWGKQEFIAMNPLWQKQGLIGSSTMDTMVLESSTIKAAEVNRSKMGIGMSFLC